MGTLPHWLRSEGVRGLSVNKQVLWNLFPASNCMQKVKIPGNREHNVICWSKSVKFKQQMRFEGLEQFALVKS